MPTSSYQPPAIIGQEGTPEAALAFAYIISPHDAREPVFLTSYQEDITITGLPAEYAAAPAQLFEAVQIDHGAITLSTEFTRQQFEVQMPYDSNYLNELIYTISSKGLAVTILRISVADLNGDSLVTWGEDTYIVQSGEQEDFAIAGDSITITCVPKPLHMAMGVPRLWFSRSCQHALFGAACGLTKATYKKAGQMTPTNPRTRAVNVTGLTITAPADHFTSGTMVHVASGEEFSIITGSLNDAAGTLAAVLGHYSDQFTAGDEVELYPGCRHTVAYCDGTFGNKVNFGGFPHIPNSNPSISGAG